MGGEQYPNAIQAGVYASVLHYLRAVAAIKQSSDGKAVVNEMKKLPTDDPLFGQGIIRADGRKVHDMSLFDVKKPSESKSPWSSSLVSQTIPAVAVWRHLSAAGQDQKRTSLKS